MKEERATEALRGKIEIRLLGEVTASGVACDGGVLGGEASILVQRGAREADCEISRQSSARLRDTAHRAYNRKPGNATRLPRVLPPLIVG